MPISSVTRIRDLLFMSALSMLVAISQCAEAQSNPAASNQKAGGIFREAFELYQSGQLKASEILFKRGLLLSPEDFRALFLLAEVQMRLEKPTEAQLAYEQVIRIAPDSKEAALSEVALDPLKQRAALASERQRATAERVVREERTRD